MLEALRKYADFEGRARRSEYWLFVLFNVLVMAGLMVLLSVVIAVFAATAGVGPDGHLSDEGANQAAAVTGVIFAAWVLFALGMFIPGLAVRVRRLHDIGQSGWMILIALVPLVGGIALFVMSVLDGDARTNEYGPDPKGRGEPRQPGQFA